MVDNLNGSWQLVFTTGTVNTQKKLLGGQQINYFPLKAVQSFDAKTWKIQNGIYVGEFCVIKFSGDFRFDLAKRRVEFIFDNLCLFQFLDVALKRGQAAELGASTGLGSESNVENAARNKSAFFNWISADRTIATARGGGGGLALWKRI
jgi:PAP_fibrillin